MSPPTKEAEEIPYERSQMGRWGLLIEVEFDRPEIDRLKAGIPRGPIGVTRFTNRAALAEADRLAAEAASQELLEAD